MGTIAFAGCSAGSTDSDQNGGDSPADSTDDDQSDGDSPSTTEDSGGSGGTDGGSGSWTETDTVDMPDDLKFKPERIQVSKGTTVTWKNSGSVAHSITAYGDELPDGAAYFASGGADSQQAAEDAYPDKGSVAKGESYEHTFETTGTYKYYCIPHEMNGMVGYVKVV